MKNQVSKCLTKFFLAVLTVFIIVSSASGSIADEISDAGESGNLTQVINLFDSVPKQKLTSRIIGNYIWAIGMALKSNVSNKDELRKKVREAFRIAVDKELLDANIVANYIRGTSSIEYIREAFDTAVEKKLLNPRVFFNYIRAERKLHKGRFERVRYAFQLFNPAEESNKKLIDEDSIRPEFIHKGLKITGRRQPHSDAAMPENVANEPINPDKPIYDEEHQASGSENDFGTSEEAAYQEDDDGFDESIASSPVPYKKIIKTKKRKKNKKPQLPVNPTRIDDLEGKEKKLEKEILTTTRYKAVKKFFDPKKSSDQVEELISKFKKEYQDSKLSEQELNITGLTSRMRITLINRIVKEKISKFRRIDRRFWENISNAHYRDIKPTILKVGDFKYRLTCHTTKDQPGNGEISILAGPVDIKGIGNIKAYRQIVKWVGGLKSNNEDVLEYIDLLLQQKKYGDPITLEDRPKASCILNFINLLLDYEEARRRVDGDVWGELPIAIHLEIMIRELKKWSGEVEHGKDLLSLFMSKKYRHVAEQKLAEMANISKATEAQVRERLESLHGPDEYSDDEYDNDAEGRNSKRLKREVKRYIKNHKLQQGIDSECEAIAKLYKIELIVYQCADGDKFSKKEFGQQNTKETVALWFNNELYQLVRRPIITPKDILELKSEDASKDLYRVILSGLGNSNKVPTKVHTPTSVVEHDQIDDYVKDLEYLSKNLRQLVTDPSKRQEISLQIDTARKQIKDLNGKIAEGNIVRSLRELIFQCWSKPIDHVDGYSKQAVEDPNFFDTEDEDDTIDDTPSENWYDKIDDPVLKISREQAEKEGEIGPRFITDWVIYDVAGDGNCLFYALEYILQGINHPVLAEIPEGTDLHDVLRLRAQGQNHFHDREYAGDDEIFSLAHQLNLIVAVVDTRNPGLTYTYYFINQEGNEDVTTNENMLPENLRNGGRIARIAYTGNHYMVVEGDTYGFDLAAQTITDDIGRVEQREEDEELDEITKGIEKLDTEEKDKTELEEIRKRTGELAIDDKKDEVEQDGFYACSHDKDSHDSEPLATLLASNDDRLKNFITQMRNLESSKADITDSCDRRGTFAREFNSFLKAIGEASPGEIEKILGLEEEIKKCVEETKRHSYRRDVGHIGGSASDVDNQLGVLKAVFLRAKNLLSIGNGNVRRVLLPELNAVVED